MSGLSFGSDSSSKDATQNQLQNVNNTQHSFGTGSTMPVNSQQIMDALDFARAPLFHQNGETDAAQQATISGANQARGTAGQGAGFLGDTLGGGFLNSNPANAMLNPIAQGSADGRWSNPFADQAFQNGASQIEGRMRGAFGGSDVRPGGGLEQAALGNSLSGLASQIYLPTAMQERQNQIGAINQIGSNWAGERANQMGALAAVPGMVGATLAPGQAQTGAAYQPLNTLIGALAALNPGQTTTKDVNLTGSGFGQSQGQSQANGNASSKGLSI
jgi:hypothetical protein